MITYFVRRASDSVVVADIDCGGYLSVFPDSPVHDDLVLDLRDFPGSSLEERVTAALASVPAASPLFADFVPAPVSLEGLPLE